MQPAARATPRAGGRPNARYTPLDAPGPLPADLLRAVPAIGRDPLGYLERVVGRYGDLVAFPLPRGAVLLVNDPDGARRVLQDNARNYSKHTIQYRSLAAVTGEGLLTADGDTWRAHRRLAQPAFHHGALPGFAAQAVAAGERLRAAWDAAGPGPLDADAELMRALFALVGRAMFDGDVAGEAERTVAAVDAALHLLVRRARSPVPGSWPTPSRHRLRRWVRTIDLTCADLVAARRRRDDAIEDAGAGSGAGAGEAARAAGDVLGLLLRAGDAGELSPQGIRDEIVTMIIAGYETVASCLTWTLGLLADRPDVQEALARELATVLGDRAPAWSDLPRLRLARAVVDESLRLYPPAWLITRRAVADDEIAGVAVPAGTLVILSPWLLHRRPADWPDPLRFDPARFLPPTFGSEPGSEPGSKPGSKPGGGGGSGRSAAPRPSYLPFGLGPRLCIGRDVALVEAVLILATLLRGRRVHRPTGATPPAVAALVTLRPRGGLPLHLTPSTP